jgi:hypothetical protein
VLGQPVPFRETNFDTFVRVSLRRALQGAEPSPAVWERIESRLVGQRDVVPGQTLYRSLQRSLLMVQQVLFSAPRWQERLAERRMPLRLQLMAYPGMGCVPLAVV